MRTGVLTFHSASNCGAVLQTSALQTHLSSLDQDVLAFSTMLHSLFIYLSTMGVDPMVSNGINI